MREASSRDLCCCLDGVAAGDEVLLDEGLMSLGLILVQVVALLVLGAAVVGPWGRLGRPWRLCTYVKEKPFLNKNDYKPSSPVLPSRQYCGWRSWDS